VPATPKKRGISWGILVTLDSWAMRHWQFDPFLRDCKSQPRLYFPNSDTARSADRLRSIQKTLEEVTLEIARRSGCKSKLNADGHVNAVHFVR
jgi:hypothetical protein